MKCSRCGECRKGLSEIVVYEEDIDRWKKINRKDILEHFLLRKTKKPNEYLSGFLDENGNEVYTCPFFREDGNVAKCLIYNARPTTCRENPEIDTNVCDKEAYLKAAMAACS